MVKEEEEKLPLVRLGRRDEDENEDFPMSHNEALARVRETIKDLATDLDEVDRYVLLTYPVLRAF